MKKILSFQFSKPKSDLEHYLGKPLFNAIRSKITTSLNYSRVTLPATLNIHRELFAKNIAINGSSLIRCIVEEFIYEEQDVKSDAAYVLFPSFNSDKEIRLIGGQSKYFKCEYSCEICGQVYYSQTSNLSIVSGKRFELDLLETGDLIISSRLKALITENSLSGIYFRAIDNEPDFWQVKSDVTAIVETENPHIQKIDLCMECGHYRIYAVSNTNGVDMLHGPKPTPCIRWVPVLPIKSLPGDFAKTHIEFGTIGRRPSGGPLLDPWQYSQSRSSNPKWLVSGRFAKLLFSSNIKGFNLAPTSIGPTIKHVSLERPATQPAGAARTC